MAKSSQFEINYGRHKSELYRDSSLMKDEEVAVIRDLLGVTRTWSRASSEAISMTLLVKIQQRAKLLLLGN